MEIFKIIDGALMETNIDCGGGPKRGKVRDIYDLGDKLVIIATDRISCFDVVMANGIPDKGRVLTQISNFWFNRFSEIVNHHVLGADVSRFPEPFDQYAEELQGRAILVKKTKVLPIECVVRGYITGSGWKSYLNDGTVCGIGLPVGLKQCEKLPELLFTPATKAELGQHDENISVEKCKEIIGFKPTSRIMNMSLDIFKSASWIAEAKGIILADTKFEFGYELRDDGSETFNIILIDEVLTPDSSRFWPADKYEPGRDQESFDKQYVRNYLESIRFDKNGSGVELPDDVVANTREKYLAIFKMLTGACLPNSG